MTSVATTEPHARALSPTQLEELLLRADRAQVMGSLSRGMAHDLRGPLQTLTLLVDPHADFLTPGEGNRLRGAMSDSVQHLADTITRFSQIYAAQELEPMPIIVEELLTYVADLQRYQRGLPLAEVEVRLPGGLAPVRGVEAQLRHALLSLVINAKEALADHPAPSITLAAEPGDGGMRLLVEDNGPGMTDEQRQRALEPFHTTRDGHLGIGLPVAARLAEKNGGRLALERRAEGGTRAILRLPCWKRP